MKKVKLSGGKVAVLKDDITTGTLLDAITFIKKEDEGMALKLVLKDAVDRIETEDGESVKKNIEKLPARDGMKLIEVASDILEKAMEGVEVDEKKDLETSPEA